MLSYIEHNEVPCSNANEGYAACGFDLADGEVDEEVLNSCTVCDSKSTMRCSVCGTPYCNRECLVKDWPHHKTLCKTAKDEPAANETNTVRAILFPMDSSKPTWIRINLERLDLSIVRALGIKERKPLRKPTNKLLVTHLNKTLKHRKIGYGIRQFTVPRARIVLENTGNHLNESIFALADPGSLLPYFGSAVFLCFRTHTTGDGTEACRYEDATPRDLRLIIEWYYTRPDNPFISSIHRLPIKSYSSNSSPSSSAATAAAVQLWPAVQILCDGDHMRLAMLHRKGLHNIQNVHVLSTDAFRVRAPSDFPHMAGLPWLVQPRHSAVDPILDGDRQTALLHNWTGRVYALNHQTLFRRWNTDYAGGWVLPEHLESTHAGSMLILHERGCLIDQMHIVGFCEYVDLMFKEVEPLLTYERVVEVEEDEEEEREARVVAPRDELERLITRKGFEEFWEKWIVAEVGRLAPLYPSPYNETYAGVTDPEPMTEDEVEAARQRVEEMMLNPRGGQQEELE